MGKSKLIVARGEELHAQHVKENRGEELAKELLEMFEDLHSLPEIYDNDIDLQLMEDEIRNIKSPKKLNFRRGLTTFSPSSANKCKRELYYKALRAEQDEQPFYTFQRRWLRNATAVHEAVQRDLLLAEKHLDDPAFTVERMEDGSIAWEDNLKDVKVYRYRDVEFQLFGMMDGIIRHRDGTRIGFEYKTKSTTIAAVGDFLMKGIQDSHLEQAIAYSVLFGVDEFLFVYESLAKDYWNKGEEARVDMRAFHFKPTSEQKKELFDKFADVAKKVKARKLPEAEFPERCMFCSYKSVCEKDGGYDSVAVEEEKRRKEEERQRKAEERKRKKKASK